MPLNLSKHSSPTIDTEVEVRAELEKQTDSELQDLAGLHIFFKNDANLDVMKRFKLRKSIAIQILNERAVTAVPLA